MAHYNVVVAVKRGDRTFYNRVGALFENHSNETGERYYKVVLDYPVGATELLAFAPRPDEAASGEDAAGQAPGSGQPTA